MRMYARGLAYGKRSEFIFTCSIIGHEHLSTEIFLTIRSFSYNLFLHSLHMKHVFSHQYVMLSGYVSQ